MNDTNQNFWNNINSATPVQNVTPTPMPATGVNVVPQVTPAPVQPVTPTPVQTANVTPVTPAPVQEVAINPFSDPVTPISVSTTAPSAPVTPTVSAAPATEEVKPVTPVQEPVPAAPAAEEVTLSPTNTDNQEITVISTKKSVVSNVILIIIIGLLIAFVFNMDTVIEYYERYMETGSLTKPEEIPTDNLTNGYILIDDNSSSIRVENIRFYNFRKSDNTVLTFSFESGAKYETPSNLGIYIELYNYNKELLYKGLFDTKKVIEKDVVRTYSITLDNDVYSDVQFALVKQYTEEEKNSTSKMTCSAVENNINRSITYNFKNNGLASYDVKETGDTFTIEKRLEDVKDKFNATMENGELKYTVNLESELNDYKPLYEKDTTMIIIKNKEVLKKWTCE